MHMLGKRKERQTRQQGKPKPVRYLNWRDMPYEGCGPMYEYPHYCPVHLFTATSPPETLTTEPLSTALVEALKRKFDRLDAELKEQLEDDRNDEMTAQFNKCAEAQEPLIEWKAIPRKTYHMPLVANGDNTVTTKDKSTNVGSAEKLNNGNPAKQKPRKAHERMSKVPHFRVGILK